MSAEGREIDDLIRARGGSGLDVRAGEDVDDAIRRATGRQPPAPPPGPDPSATAAQIAAARLAGLPEQHAHRITGDGEAAVADARRFRDALVAAGAEPAPTSFDGGARGGPGDPPPSMDSLIRGHRDAQRAFAARAVDDHDRGGSR